MPRMSAEIGPKFTSLKHEMKTDTAMKSQPTMPHYPTLYLDKEIPGIGSGDIGKKLRAEIKIVPTSINRNEHNGAKSVSFSVEVTEIRII